MTREVFCVKFQRMMPGLERIPYPGELGQRIYDHISQEAWEMWQRHKILLINHNGLVLIDPEAQQFLREQMEAFLFSEEGRMPEGWVPEAAGAKGAPARAKK